MWSRSLTGGGRLLEVFQLYSFDWEGFAVLDRRSLMGGGRT